MTAQLDGLARQVDETAQQPPRWAESLAEHIEVLRAQVAPVAELHSLWADLGRALEATRPSQSSRSGPASWTRSSRRSRGAPR
jgi:ABC-type transporter Mla subunit MlaD